MGAIVRNVVKGPGTRTYNSSKQKFGAIKTEVTVQARRHLVKIITINLILV